MGIPVVPFVAANRKEYDSFYRAIERALAKRECIDIQSLDKHYRELDGGCYKSIYDLMPAEGIEGYSPLWLAAKVLEGDIAVTAKVHEELSAEERKTLQEILAQVTNGALLTGDCKFKWIDETLKGAISGKKQRATLSKFDKKATSKRWVKWMAVGILLLGLIASFIPAMPIMLIGSSIPALGEPIAAGLAAIGAP